MNSTALQLQGHRGDVVLKGDICIVLMDKEATQAIALHTQMRENKG